jgi:hypothetical protein
MSQIEIFLIVVVAAAVSLAGWGWTVTQLAGSPGLPVALVAAVGMAALLFLGGMLNLARCAVPHAIDGLVLMGLGLAGLALYRNRARFTVKWRPDHAVTILGMGAVGFIVLRHLTPQSAFNWNDDFERYFSYPVRMLQTGTVGGNPLGYMGVDTLGGQAFLQTFLVRYFPIEYIGSLDTGVALLLCLALAGGAGPNRQGVVLTAAAQLALIAIDPQLVNVSSVFTTAALVMAACFLGRNALEPTGKLAPFVLLGLVYAGLVTLRTTNVVFVGIHFGALLAVAATGRSFGRRFVWQWVSLAGLTALFLLPWFAVHRATYLAALGASVTVPSTDVIREPFNLFSTAIPFYGVPQLHFTLVVLGGLIVAAAWFFAGRKQPFHASPGPLAGVAAAITCAACYLVLVVVLAPLIFGQEASMRYYCPMLIGAFPVTIQLLGGAEGSAHPRQRWITALLGFGLFAVFFPSLQRRFRQIRDHGSPLAFTSLATSEFYGAYNRDVLHGKVVLSGYTPGGSGASRVASSMNTVKRRKNAPGNDFIAGERGRGWFGPFNSKRQSRAGRQILLVGLGAAGV